MFELTAVTGHGKNLWFGGHLCSCSFLEEWPNGRTHRAGTEACLPLHDSLSSKRTAIQRAATQGRPYTLKKIE
jgi:hypothetical protein